MAFPEDVPQISVNRPVFTEENFTQTFLNTEDLLVDNRPFYRRLQKTIIEHFSRVDRSCMKETIFKLFPILDWLPNYDLKRDLLADFTGGAMVGIMHISLGLAFAMLASLPPVTGLYTALVPVLIYMLMGTSRYLSQGSFAVICLMVAQVIEREVQNMDIPAAPTSVSPTASFNGSNMSLSTTGSLVSGNAMWSPLDAKKLEISVSLALLIGFMQIAMGVAKLGFVTNYLSDPLISGFTTGSAVLVVVSQLKHILGQNVPQISGVFASVKIVVYLLKYIATSNLGAIVTGVLCFGVIIGLKYLSEKYKSKLPVPIPAELFVVVIATAISYGGAINRNFGVQILGKIPKGLPPISIPSLQLMSNIIPDAFVISVVIFATNISLTKMFAKKHGQTIDTNQELIAYGVCNVGASFFSSFAICNALARTAVQENLANTQLCSIPVIILVLLVLLFIAPLFFHLPKAVLAAVLIANLIGLLRQFSRLKQLWTICKVDAVVWSATCFGVFLLGVDLGLGLGVLVAVLTVVIRSSRPRHSLLGHVDGTDIYRDTNECSQAMELPGIKILRFESSLYFVNIECFRDLLVSISGVDPSKPALTSVGMISDSKLTQEEEEDKVSDNTKEESYIIAEDTDFISIGGTLRKQAVHAVVIDASAFTFIDSAGMSALSSIIKEYSKCGVHVCLASCSYEIRKQLMVGGCMDGLDGHYLFVSLHDAVTHILASRKTQGTIQEQNANTDEVTVSLENGNEIPKQASTSVESSL